MAKADLDITVLESVSRQSAPIMSVSPLEDTPSWDSGDVSEVNHSLYTRPTLKDQALSLESPSTSPGSHLQLNSIPVQPRSSSDLASRPSTSKWRDMLPVTNEFEDNTVADTASTLVEPGFDENVLRSLCELDIGSSRVWSPAEKLPFSSKSVQHSKKSMVRGLQKLARTTSEAYAMSDGKAGTFVNAWQSSMRIHEVLAENRLRFASRLNEMSEELGALSKEVDKNRKQTKDLSSRYERALQESEMLTEKCKSRLDSTSEELERVLLQKEGESFKDTAIQGRGASGVSGKRALGKAVAKGGLLLKGKNPGNIQRQEDDIRQRMSAASDAYRKAVTDTQSMRQEYFNFQLPRLLRSLKECADEIDLGTQYHLTRYAFLFESIVLSDGTTLVPTNVEDGPGLKATTESIDNRADFKVYMQNYAFARGAGPSRGPRREGPQDEGFLPPLPSHGGKVYSNGHSSSQSTSAAQLPDRGRPTFGVDLAEQMARDDVEVPPIVIKCCQAIEKYGIRSQGIYRISGASSKVAKLRDRLDKDLESVNLDAEEWMSDINNVTSVLKMWLRELPVPLFCFNHHQGFIEAAKIENDRLRHIRLHERVNALPDPNYTTLKYFMGHLYRINSHESENSMSIQNLAIVFGPTLFGQQIPVNGTMNGQPGGIVDTGYQNKAVETILEHYTDIFVDEHDEQ